MPVSEPTAAPSAASQPDWPVFDPRHSLRARAALLFAAAAALLTALAAWVGGALMETRCERTSGAAFEAAAYQAGTMIERTIHDSVQALQFTASAVSLRGDIAAAEQRVTLEMLLEVSPDLGWVGFATPDGNVHAATQHILEGSRIAETPWFRAAQSRTYVGPVRQNLALAQQIAASEGGDSRFVDVAVPVQTRDGQPAGVLAASVRWAIAETAASSAIVDVLRRQQVATTIHGGSGEPVFDSGMSGWTEPPDVPAFAVTGPLRGFGVEQTADGATFLTGYARLRGYRDFPGLPLIVVVRQKLADAFAPAVELRRVLILGGAAATILFGVLGWLVATPISRQLRRIAAAARRIQSGDTLAILPAPAGEGDVARACGALRNLVEDLRDRVADHDRHSGTH